MTEAMKITQQDGKLIVPNYPIIPFIEGDGIGPEIWEVASKVIDAAVESAYKGEKKIAWKEIYAGEKAHRLTGEWLPKETLATIRNSIVAIKGPLTTPVGGGIRSLNVTLRQTLDLYVCLRPVQYFQGVPSPLKFPEKINMTVFRENTEDIYAGIEYESGTQEVKDLITVLQQQFGVNNIRFPETSAIGIKPVSKEGTERLVHAAISHAIQEGKKSVTLVHKGNIMKYTEGGFKNWGYQLCETAYNNQVFTWQQYERMKHTKGKAFADEALREAEQAGKVIIKDCIADNFLQQILINPEQFDVIATLNLNGDYISDALAAQVGGIGIAPGANINFQTGHAIFEATHGTAPSFAGLNKVNPSSVLLSGVMLLEYIGWKEAANLIAEGIEKTIASKTVTFDFANLMDDAIEVSTQAFGDAIIDNMTIQYK